MILNHLIRRASPEALYLLVLGVIVFAVFGCQELPTEPTPIDLSKDQPIAVDDQVSTPEESLVRIQVLANDSSLVDDDLELTEIVTQPNFGEATIDGNAIEYVPQDDYNGTDSLRYRVSGSVLSSTARVTITITPVNDPPVAADDMFTISESIAARKGQAENLDVLTNDTDIDGDVLRIIRTGVPSSGSVQIATDGFSLSYDPTPDFNGSSQFTYTISDGNGGQDLATVTVSVLPVNDPPSVTSKSYATSEDVTRSQPAPGVLAGATDPENDPLTAVLVTDVQHGSLNLMADGAFEYVPDADFNGSDSFAFAASDGMLQSAPAIATITVLAANDPPVAAPDAYDTEEDETLEVSAPGVLANDVDIDGDQLTVTLTTGPLHGELDLRGDGSFSYDPEPGYSGADEFEYQIDDGTLASRAIVSISIGEVSDAPNAVPDQYDAAANVGIFVPPPGVLDNDSDEDGDALTAVLVDPSDGELALESNGSFVYTPPPNFTGTDSFTYRASDGANLSAVTNVAILVSAQGNPPVAQDDEYAVAENEVLEVPAPGLLENDSDVDEDELTVILVEDVGEGDLELGPDGGFTYTPPLDFVGVVTFSYRARDAANVSATAFVTITIGQ